MKNQVCQTTGLLETIIIFVWALFKFWRPGFGVEMDILRESLQVEKCLRVRGGEEVLAGNMWFEEEEKKERDAAFDLQNLDVWQEEKNEITNGEKVGKWAEARR